MILPHSQLPQLARQELSWLSHACLQCIRYVHPSDLPEDHPEAHTPDTFNLVPASHLVFTRLEEMADRAGQFKDAGEGMHAGPQIEIVLLPLEAHAALRDYDEGDELDEDFYSDNGDAPSLNSAGLKPL